MRNTDKELWTETEMAALKRNTDSRMRAFEDLLRSGSMNSYAEVLRRIKAVIVNKNVEMTQEDAMDTIELMARHGGNIMRVSKEIGVPEDTLMQYYNGLSAAAKRPLPYTAEEECLLQNALIRVPGRSKRSVKEKLASGTLWTDAMDKLLTKAIWTVGTKDFSRAEYDAALPNRSGIERKRRFMLMKARGKEFPEDFHSPDFNRAQSPDIAHKEPQDGTPRTPDKRWTKAENVALCYGLTMVASDTEDEDVDWEKVAKEHVVTRDARWCKGRYGAFIIRWTR